MRWCLCLNVRWLPPTYCSRVCFCSCWVTVRFRLCWFGGKILQLFFYRWSYDFNFLTETRWHFDLLVFVSFFSCISRGVWFLFFVYKFQLSQLLTFIHSSTLHIWITSWFVWNFQFASSSLISHFWLSLFTSFWCLLFYWCASNNLIIGPLWHFKYTSFHCTFYLLMIVAFVYYSQNRHLTGWNIPYNWHVTYVTYPSPQRDCWRTWRYQQLVYYLLDESTSNIRLFQKFCPFLWVYFKL